MKRITSEKQLLKQLGISDFRHITKDKLLAFTSSIDKVDPEVAKAAISQFPNFKEMVSEILNNYFVFSKDLIVSDQENERIMQECFKKEHEALLRMLESEQLTIDVKIIILNRLKQLDEQFMELNKTSKEFKLSIYAFKTGIIISSIGISAALLCGHIFRLNKDAKEDEDEDEDNQ